MNNIEKHIPFVMPTNWSKRMPNGEKIPGGSPSIYAKMMIFGVYRPTQEPTQSDKSDIDIRVPNINTDDIGTILDVIRPQKDMKWLI